MSFRLVPNSVTLNDVIAITLRNFTEFGSFWDRHDMEVFVYLDQATAGKNTTLTSGVTTVTSAFAKNSH